MISTDVFDRFVEDSPVCVMVQTLLRERLVAHDGRHAV